jgi:hypothetical protein
MKGKDKEISTKKTRKTKINNQSDFKKALIKKALGYDYKEVVEEYVSSDEGEIKLTKKKVTKKNVPPDITAIKLLLEDMPNISSMTDEELLKEKERLLKLIKEEN